MMFENQKERGRVVSIPDRLYQAVIINLFVCHGNILETPWKFLVDCRRSPFEPQNEHHKDFTLDHGPRNGPGKPGSGKEG
jgi:hypothetical protein